MVSFSALATLSLVVISGVVALPAPEEASPFANIERRAASCTFPTPPSSTTLSSPITVGAGATYDGGNKRFDRGSGACEDGEGGDADAVFLLQEGATLKNVVIGANQQEGIHCLGACNIQNVWFEDVCEDAITIKQSSSSAVSNIIGGGAKGASDKIVQHNGAGTVKIDSYCIKTFGKLYRSCGNCSTQYARKVLISQINATSGSVLAGVNSNYGDVATLDTASIVKSSVSSMCDTYKGNNSGAEPTKLTSNVANANCKF